MLKRGFVCSIAHDTESRVCMRLATPFSDKIINVLKSGRRRTGINELLVTVVHQEVHHISNPIFTRCVSVGKVISSGKALLLCNLMLNIP